MADLIIRDLTPSQLTAVTRALSAAGVEFETTAPVYTPDEALALLEDLAPRQQSLLCQLVEWDGVLTPQRMRADAGGNLRGLTGPITKASERLVASGAIRPHLASPITTVYDPTIRRRQQARAFKMSDENVASFAVAIERLSAAPPPE